MKQYHPYPANDGKHNYYIITKSGRKVLFGAVDYSDFTKHKDENRRQRYVNRHKNNDNWEKSGIDSAGFLSRWLLWNKSTIKESYGDIKKNTYNHLSIIVLVMYGCLKKPYIISNASFKSVLGLQVYKLILQALFLGYVCMV
jgi:hypothetical protein